MGYRVNSGRATQFRIWATKVLKEYMTKGFALDDERLKQGTYLTDKYFDEQLERIREIRASERKFYQKITDIYATAIDYDKTSATTKRNTHISAQPASFLPDQASTLRLVGRESAAGRCEGRRDRAPQSRLRSSRKQFQSTLLRAGRW